MQKFKDIIYLQYLNSLQFLLQNLEKLEAFYHRDQIFAISPKALTWRMLKHASTSKCKAVSRLLSWIFPKVSFQTHPQPLNCAVEVHEPSTMQILSRLMTWNSSQLCSCGAAGRIISFALNHAWHSLSAYQTNSNGSLSVPPNNVSFRAYQIYQISQREGSLSSSGSTMLFFFQKR